MIRRRGYSDDSIWFGSVTTIFSIFGTNWGSAEKDVEKNSWVGAHPQRAMGRNNATDEVTSGTRVGDLPNYMVENTHREVFMEVYFACSDSTGYLMD